MKIVVSRIFSNEHKTLSNCMVVEDKKSIYKFKGIELPWNDNKRRISCIPPGMYKAVAVRRSSNKKYALWVQDVPGRSEIMVHTANYARQLLGCLAPGVRFADIDGDGILDVVSSQMVMDKLQELIPLGTEIEYHVVDSWRVYGNNVNYED